MNIDKIQSKEKQSDYLDHVEGQLNSIGLTFHDLKQYKRSGRSKHGKLDTVFKDIFGSDAKQPDFKIYCLCGHRIVEQCYLCPADSNNPDDILVLGNHCIDKWGFTPAIRGKGKKIDCELCGAILNTSGLRRHHKTSKCKSKSDTSSAQTSGHASTISEDV